MWNSIAWCFVDQCLLRNVNHESEYSWNIVISSVLYLLCSVTLQTTPDLRRTEKHFNRISGRQAFLLDCFQAMGDCFTVILIDKMPMEAFIRSWTFQAWRVFRSEVSWDNNNLLSQSVSQSEGETEGDNMKTYQVSMETIGATDDTMGLRMVTLARLYSIWSDRLLQAANDWDFLPIRLGLG